jgi:hypothetical protein
MPGGAEMSVQFACEICGVTRTVEEGAGQWFTIGINDFGPSRDRRKHVNVYWWPLGCRSLTEREVKHACSITHMLTVVEKWAGHTGERKV